MTSEKKGKTREDIVRFIGMVVQKQNWRLNPDAEFLSYLIDGLLINYNRYGYFSCPCRDAVGNRENDEDIICPCKYCRPDQEQYGHCFCGLYATPDFFESGRIPKSIPDRKIY